MDNNIRIECAGNTLVNIDELSELQNFGVITDQHYAHGRNSIVKLGFSFPFFFWADEAGRKWILDGHGRKNILTRMRTEGFTIPPLPADPVFAKNKKEAKEKLIAQESRYKNINESEFADFLTDEGLVFEDIADFADIPGLDLTDKENRPMKYQILIPCDNEEDLLSKMEKIQSLGIKAKRKAK